MIVFALSAAACAFKQTQLRGVMSYRDGRVYIKKGDYYRVGVLPKDWRRISSKAKAITFYNDGLRSSISTDAFCGPKVENTPLKSLGGDVISALDKRTLISEEEIQLDGRGAIRRKVTGSLDGVTVFLDHVTTRKNGCVFDFYAVTPSAESAEVSIAFEAFFNGYGYSHR